MYEMKPKWLKTIFLAFATAGQNFHKWTGLHTFMLISDWFEKSAFFSLPWTERRKAYESYIEFYENRTKDIKKNIAGKDNVL